MSDDETKSTNNQLFVFDFTINLTKSNDKLTSGEVIEKIKHIAKKWVFQLEKGESSEHNHFQGRLSLHEKQRLTSLPKLVGVKGWRWSRTSSENKGNMFYVMKEDTRIDGPWKDTPSNLQPLPWHLKPLAENKRPFQLKIMEWMNHRDSRAIDIIYDLIGNTGKSSFATLLQFQGLAYSLLASKNTNEMCADLCDELTDANDFDPKLVLVDLERAYNQEDTAGIFSALERIKGGLVKDRRYKLRKVFFGSPRVVVFMNRMPELWKLSKDRWRFWRMNEEYDLEPMSFCEVNEVIVAQNEERNH